MHPPLDRPHPDCQAAIRKLRDCHDTKPRLKFWACNELKFELDMCFKEEKHRHLLEVNKGFETRRLEEDQESAKSTGRNVSFEEFLQKDASYQKELRNLQDKKQSASWFG
mmetsp:Transcript_23326/g.65065  ORF Transcript_23326/g.65065 Transcript_23326/m.65065 type:complete len:110 (-) Transcript_23326:350-679(-)|eukprot:CAMPEP_0198118348 /NCGR_PEP_ID=MMETSP1442-20131203/21326_1 /TAXON_ID= /ORGANISM="Craspedostauros australis, Strain CCMP3328" /LENGTH=109 /DNA_ID=CAMNT_0043776593 /DNA_START=162 /DNA_END=491 /DNA_ORIENTATION=-